MFNTRAMAALINPNNWIAFGTQLLRATPVLTPIYLALLAGLQALPVHNPNADLERLAELQQQIAALATVEIHMLWVIVRRRFLRA